MGPKQFISKAFLYLNRKYASRYIDKPYWKLADPGDSSKITTVLFEDLSAQIGTYLPGTVIEREEAGNHPYYRFLMHIFSRYVYRITDALIDPDFQWVILKPGSVFRYSYPMIEDPWDKEKMRPSLLRFRNPLRKTRMIDKAILVRYQWSNYYHFFVDTLPQIMLCDSIGLPQHIPVIVPAYFPGVRFVQAYFRLNPPKRPIIVQPADEYFRVHELYVAKDTFFSESVRSLHELLPALAPGGSDDAPQRIYVTRNRKDKRTIKNAAEIEEIVKRYGFTIVDAGANDLATQIRLFSRATHIVGIHGAALMNIICCRNPGVRIFEIFPGNDLTPGHYKNLSEVLGYRYSSIIGAGLDEHSEFCLDKDLFLKQLTDLMQP